MNASPRLLIGLACVLCFVSALCGALLALAIDSPEIVVTERVVEVLPPPPDLSPVRDDLAVLQTSYVERGGMADEWTASAVEEIASGVCNSSHDEESELVDVYTDDPGITLEASELLEFFAEIRLVCVSG